MSDYQRFISYIYEYKNQEKSQNCGFCKVEIRNGQCRMEIHMKPGSYPYNPDFQVYTFVSRQGKLQGISLGSANYQQGNLQGTFSFSESSIQNSIYTFNDLGGILIQADTGQVFASAWKDYEIRPAAFTLEKQEVPSKEASSSNESNSSSAETFSLSEPNITSSSNAPSNSSKNTFTPNQSKITFEQSSQNLTSAEITQESYVDEPEENPKDVTSTESQPPEEPFLKIFPLDYWENLQQSYPQVQPFFDDEIHNCIQIPTKDLDYLSTLGFCMNNNRFFQHACDNFHHFLLGFTAEDNLPILAIPGIYSELEYYLASAFGFPYFKSAKNEANFPGQFIYWFKPL